MISTIASYSADGGTPTFKGLDAAIEMLKGSTADKKVIVLLSDGDPYYTVVSDNNAGPIDSSNAGMWNDSLTEIGEVESCKEIYWYRSAADGGDEYAGTKACVAQMHFEHIVQNREDIDFFSAVIANDLILKGYMAHASSNVCGREWGDVSDCDLRDNVQYAYSATTKDEILKMYNEMIKVILQMSFASVVSTDGGPRTTAGGIGLGSDVVLPFPDLFTCTGEPINMPFSSTFYVPGTVNFSDFKFTYCPVPPAYQPSP